jgi:hypothetical protein
MANPRASRAAISREAVSKFMWDFLLSLPEKPLGRPMARDNPATIPLRRGSLGAAEFFHLALEGLQNSPPSRDEKNDVFAKLRCPVEHAGLAAHKRRLNLMFLDRRKDLSDRGRDQGYLPWLNMERRFSRFPGSARAE